MRKILLLTVFSIFIVVNFCSAQGGIITIFAGNGSGGYSGDGGPATAAQVGSPFGIVFDNAGNMYSADGVVRKINAAGIITTVAGNGVTGYSGDGGPATAAETDAYDVAVDASGNIYIADNTNNVVRKVNSSGIITTFAGIGSIGYSGDGGPATAAQLNNVWGVAIDPTGNVYISDENNHVIRKVDTFGIITTFAGTGGFGYSGDGGPATAALLHSPAGIISDASGNIYIADINTHTIRKVNSAGIITTIAGTGTGGYSGDGGPATAAEFDSPWYMAISAAGDIYVADPSTLVVRKIDAIGIVTTVAGSGLNVCNGYGGPVLNAGIDPYGVAFDQAQNMYIASGHCFYITKVQFTPTIVADSFSVYIDRLCNGLGVIAFAHSSSPLNINVSFGDHSSAIIPLSATSGGYEAANVTHAYAVPGTYTIKMVLLNGATAIDSATTSYNSILCNTLPVNFFYDANGNCVKDSNESLTYFPITAEVDSNGIAIDTIAATSGFDYTAYGNPGDIYSFKVLSFPAGMYASCAPGGVITDTLQLGMYNNSSKNMALFCSSPAGFDLAEYVSTQCGRHAFAGNILINNTYCNPEIATFTANLDPKYNFQSASPAPASVSGNTITWNLGDVDAALPQVNIQFTCQVPGTWLIPGDTVNSTYSVTPIPGDVLPGNNGNRKEDTVKSSYDPNEMAVTPEGTITSGTQLQYTIDFENTGNDTAHNIYVMDTLSGNVIPSSMRILASSAVMDVIPFKAGGNNIIKFDFPNIQLLDSSHHNQCNGMLMFTINTRSGLPNGTAIFNHAGIFFDDNPVVMTDTVENIIGIPTSKIPVVNAAENLSIYPNPATDELTIKMDNDAYRSFVITNTMGQVFMQQSLTTPQTTLNIKTFAPGLYYITLRGDNGTKTQKFVKM